MSAPRFINPVDWGSYKEHVIEEGCGRRHSSNASSTSDVSHRAPFATESDRAAPPPSSCHSSGGRGKAPTLNEGRDGGYAGVKGSRINEMREIMNPPQKARVDAKISVSDRAAADDVRFHQSDQKVGRGKQIEGQKYSVDPRAREQNRFYSAACADEQKPGTKRQASCPSRRPASMCGSNISQESGTLSSLSAPKSRASVRSSSSVCSRSSLRSSARSSARSSVRSAAHSERSFGGYSGYNGSGSAVSPASRHNPFEGSICSRTSQVRSQSSSCAGSRTSALSERNLKNYGKGNFAPSARSCSSATTSASGWSQYSSDKASSLYSQ